MSLEFHAEYMDSDGENVDTYYEDEKDDSDDESKDTFSDDKDDSYYGNTFPVKRDEVLSLEKICLKNITENFTKFNVAYSTTEDASLRRNFMFLQRVYSEHMLSEATRNEYVNDSCLNFVLNEYLKELNFRDLFKCSPEAIIKRLAEIGHGINTAVIDAEIPSYCHSVSFINQALRHLPNVNVLHIPCIADDETLKVISSSCRNLKELHLDDSNITDEGIKNLCVESDNTVQVKCALKILSLRYTNVDAAGIAFLLENIPSLEVLHHHNLPTILYSMHKNDMINNTLNTARKYNLTTLDLINQALAELSDLSDFLRVCIEVCPQIKELHTPLEKENQLDLIAQFAELEKLSLECVSISKPYLELNNLLAVQGGKLKELKLSHASFSVSTLLQNCLKLESLNLSEIAFLWKEDCINTNRLNNLHELHLENFTFSEHSTEMSVHAILNCSPKLESLALSHCEIAGSEINTKIANFCAKNIVKKLSFSCSDILVTFLESILLTCSSLETLIIQECDYINTDDITSLYTIVHSKKDNVNIIWNDHRSELNSLDDFSDYDFHDSDVDPYDDYYDPYYDFEDDYCLGYGADFYD